MRMENHLEQGQSNRSLSAPGDAAVLFSLDETSRPSRLVQPLLQLSPSNRLTDGGAHSWSGSGITRQGWGGGASDHLPGTIGYICCSILQQFFKYTFVEHLRLINIQLFNICPFFHFNN